MYTKNSVGLIFVVNVGAPQRFPEAKLYLHQMLDLSHLQNCPLAIFANKYDQNEIDENVLLDRLGMSQDSSRRVKVFKTSALTGEGLHKGFYWLSDMINKESSTKEE